MTLTTVPLRRLVQSKANVRRTDRRADLDELTASIAAHGLRQNLNVRPISGGRFEVVAGGRRLMALKRLSREGHLPADHPIPCLLLAANDNPSEISLAENAVRRSMHPDDQCTAFQSLIERDGLSVEEVAARFGVTPAVVQRRLKLARVSPRLRGLHREGKLAHDQLMAFALVDDHDAQEQALSDLPECNRNPAAIRRALTRSAVSGSHRLAQFVGLQVYEAFGGPIVRDLFAEDDEVYLADAGLLERLAQDRLERASADVRAEGWSWVSIEPTVDHATRYDRVFPAMVGSTTPVYRGEDLARSGARLSIGHDGDLVVERGLVRIGEAAKPRRCRDRSADGDVDQAHLPARVVEELTAHRTAALRVELARRPDIALAATVHALSLGILYHRSSEVGSCLDMTGTHVPLYPHVRNSEDGLAHHPLADEHATWSARLPADPADLWQWCRMQTQADLLNLVAFVAALSLNAVQARHDSSASARLRHAGVLSDVLELDMAAWWRPRTEGFGQRAPKGAIVEALSEAGRHDLAAKLISRPKAEVTRSAIPALVAERWLPAPLRRKPCRDASAGATGPVDVGLAA